MVSMENLLCAWDKFKNGKREKLDVEIFELNLEDNLFKLHKDLLSKRYRHGPYTGFYIKDPKVRRIHKSEVRDRIVHHLIAQTLTPIFDPAFIPDSYSSRINHGTHKGIERLRIFTRKIWQTHKQCFVLKCDVKKFFATLDHEILLEIIGRKIKDSDVLRLIRLLVESFSQGAPIGNLTSQLFANIYMNELDQFVKNTLKVRCYIRYTNDFVVVHQDENYLRDILERITEFLKDKLKLSLHPNKVSIRKYRQGVDFLGYVTLPKARVLRTRVKHRIFNKLKERVLQFKMGKINETTLLQSFNSYMGVLSHADSHKLEKEIRHKFWEWMNEPINKNAA